MQLSTLGTLSATAFLILSMILLSLVYAFNISAAKQHQLAQQQLKVLQLSNQLERASDHLTREARRYTIFGDTRHYDAFWKEVKETRTRDKVVERLQELHLLPTELALIEKAKTNSDALIKIEDKAMKAGQDGNLDAARTLMFDAEYDRQKQLIMKPIKTFQTAINDRVAREATQSNKLANQLLIATNFTILLYVSAVISLLYLIVIRRINHPLKHITKAVTQISTGDTSIDIPHIDKNDEIGKLAKAAQVFKKSLIKNKQLANELSDHKINLENEVADRTQDLIAVNNELEEFAYRTSHDLKSPIISSVKLLEVATDSMNKNDLDLAQKTVSVTRESLVQLESLLENILILTKTKNYEEEKQEIDIDSIVNNALDKSTHIKNFSRVNISKNLLFKGTLITKTSRLSLILDNLVSNAIKYQNTEITDSYIKISTKTEGQKFILEIEDNGLGIPAKYQPQIFSMFKRFHPKVAFGSGLGLYMIKKSASVLDGEITYASLGDQNTGSVFRLTLPLS